MKSLFGNGGAHELKIPGTGKVRIAADLGASPAVLWGLACEEFGFEAQKNNGTSSSGAASRDPALQTVLSTWWQAEGQPFWLTWEGIDQNAMLPMPLLLGGVTLPVAPVEALLASAPFAPADGALLPQHSLPSRSAASCICL